VFRTCDGEGAVRQRTDCTSTNGLVARSHAGPDTNRSAGLHSNPVVLDDSSHDGLVELARCRCDLLLASPRNFATTRPTIGPVHWCSSARLWRATYGVASDGPPEFTKPSCLSSARQHCGVPPESTPVGVGLTATTRQSREQPSARGLQFADGSNDRPRSASSDCSFSPERSRGFTSMWRIQMVKRSSGSRHQYTWPRT
jgi:hypothetical protein